MHGRWSDAEAELRELLANVRANRYLFVNASTYLGLILAFRGRFHEAADLIGAYLEISVGINDLQAYGMMLVAAAHAARGRGDATAAMDHLERGIRLRGDTVEHDISTVYLFEGTDVLGWLARDPDAKPATVDRGLALLSELADRLDATAPSIGLAPVLVRNALGGAARLQLRLLAGETVDTDELARHADALRGVARVFDAARVDLWLGEATDDADARERAAAVFVGWAPGPTWSVPGQVQRRLGPPGASPGTTCRRAPTSSVEGRCDNRHERPKIGNGSDESMRQDTRT